MHRHTIRHQTYRLLDEELFSSRESRWLHSAIVVLIALNVVAVILESVDSFSVRYGALFSRFEDVSVAIFTAEYLCRFWSCVENPRNSRERPLAARLRYIVSPGALIDLLAILPYFLSILVALDLRFLRVLRLLRVFKLTRYFSALEVVLSVLKEEARAFGAALFVLMVILVLASSGIYIFEHEAQPDAFGSIPAAMWWAVATLTTVGYGDVTPITAGGRVFGATVTIVGIGMVALPAGILASAFSDQLHRRKETYAAAIDQALGDETITRPEADFLEEVRVRLGLSPEEALRIYERRMNRKSAGYPIDENTPPPCGNSIASCPYRSGTLQSNTKPSGNQTGSTPPVQNN
ncbi:MAG: ion transporter [Pseudomonadota bacterium]|nr:ion transporter [Pseudomonadota bacterium]